MCILNLYIYRERERDIYIYIYTSVIPCISMHGVKWNSCAVRLSTLMPSPVSLHCNFERQVASKACPSSHFERQVAPAQQIAVF